MFPFFVLALSSKGKCEQLRIMRASLWERGQETEHNEAKRDKREWLQQNPSLREVSFTEPIFLHNKLFGGGSHASLSELERVRELAVPLERGFHACQS